MPAGDRHTVGLRADGTVVTAGPEIELAKWDLGVIEYTITISSSAGGSVTTPGEGVLTYNAGLIIRLIAKPQTGYRFVDWSGDDEKLLLAFCIIVETDVVDENIHKVCYYCLFNLCRNELLFHKR